MAFARIQIRRDTAADWTTADPILTDGEMGYETDTGKMKIGDGSTVWTSLDYADLGYSLEFGDTAWHEIGDGGEPAFQNSWVNFTAGYSTAAFRKDSLGYVHLKGSVKSGTLDTICFTLPTGYRPNEIIIPPGSGNTGNVSTLNQIDTIGQLQIFSSQNILCGLDGVTFYAEQ